MQRSQFVVDEDGLLSEPGVTEHAAWYTERCPDIEPLAIEAQLMLMRAHGAIDIVGPLERKRGLTIARYTVLRMLVSADGQRLPMTAIGLNLNVSPTNVTKLVDNLERDGYVRRANHSNDKRRLWIELLPEGAAAVEDAYPVLMGHVTNNWADFKPEDLRLLIHFLAKLRLDIMTRQARAQMETATGYSQNSGLQLET